ncbi:MAG: FKBP-type peptidyl-prolyl cis-trans isomerase [Candidatus Sungbacteria bacterium]|nr:FKBP-type peptidyl-prolyl cis-trans isomerase [Candidatus Sungbacteria bacterium]
MKYVVVFVGVVVLLSGVLYFFLAGEDGEERVRSSANEPQDISLSRTENEKEDGLVPVKQLRDSTGLVIEDVKTGGGREAKTGDTVSVHYVGTLADGKKFDSSRDRGEPFSFTIGQGFVIQGWEQGIPGMRVGGMRKLVIPPDLAYGERAVGTIPPNSTLFFEVELLDVQSD